MVISQIKYVGYMHTDVHIRSAYSFLGDSTDQQCVRPDFSIDSYRTSLFGAA
jgi:hypothetical protein